MIAMLVAAVPVLASAAPPSEYWVDEETLPFDAVPGFEDSKRSWGVLKNAGYRIEVPADWNGDLVMWAHGFRGTDTRLFFNPEEVPFRRWLLENGYAWAASTYSANDYNIEAGVRDTRKLKILFQTRYGPPGLTYLTGASMGGHVTAASIEMWKQEYDAALPVCGVVGDFELFDYFLDFNLAAQQIGLGTSTYPVAPTYPVTTAQQIKANLEAVPGGWPIFLNSDGAALKQLTENQSGGDRPNFDEAWFFWNSFPEFGSGIPGNFLFDLGVGDGTLPGRDGVTVDNVDTVYQVDLDPDLSDYEIALNNDIFRVEADRKARHLEGIKNVPQVTGEFRVPVLTMHNLGDLFVPFHNEVEYANDAEAAGNADLLVQRAIRGVGHCGFTTTEYETAMSDLVAWVEEGVKPAGDDVSDPAAVADPTFGCEFTDFDTSGGHLLATPCP
jgi:hypothetical protein